MSCLRKPATSPRKLLYYLAARRSRIDADKARSVDKQLATDLKGKQAFRKMSVPGPSSYEQMPGENKFDFKPKRTSTARQSAFEAKTTWRAAIKRFFARRPCINQSVRNARNFRAVAWT